MAKNTKYFEKVTLLITHYNRSKSLKRLLNAFADLEVQFYEIVVSDDGSKPEHLKYIEGLKTEFVFTLVNAPKNGGLGNNINKGQDVVQTEYTLYVQEDFIPLKDFSTYFWDGLNIMEDDKKVDVVRFYAYGNYPYLKPFKNGFSEMIFNPWSLNTAKTTIYSDHPHLRRSNFLGKFGRYSEMKNPEKTEYDMMISFLKYKGKAYLFDNYKVVFEQINTSAEPSTMKRNYWRNSNNFLLKTTRYIYRQMKFNYYYYFK
jgi:glycosyltransferase involved in cell wall biosynthesis